MNPYIVSQLEKMLVISNKMELTNQDYTELHTIAWDIQVIAERHLSRMF